MRRTTCDRPWSATAAAERGEGDAQAAAALPPGASAKAKAKVPTARPIAKIVVKPRLKVVPKKPLEQAGSAGDGGAAKRQKVATAAAAEEHAEEGLAGLLGGYGSDSD